MSNSRLAIYIAGPCDNPMNPRDFTYREPNVLRAMEAGIKVAKKGHYPVIPHLYHYFDVQAHNSAKYNPGRQFYLELGMRLLWACDAFLYLGSSPGTDAELAKAIAHKLHIFKDISEIPDCQQSL